MKSWKKAGRFLCSMKFAVILLLILVAACTAGSLVPQREPESYYVNLYSAQAARAILLFGIDDIFHCAWFIVLALALCANLICCNLIHFPALVRKMKNGFSLEKCLKGWDGEAVTTVADARTFFSHMGFRKIEETPDGTYCYAVRHRVGLWGAWLCHLGMLVTIAGFGLGQMMQSEYTVYGVPGQTKPVGDTGYELTIDEFEVKLREDATVEQYLSTVTMTDTATGKSEGGEAGVNHPLSLFGMKCYQNSTGWAATVEIWKDEKKEQEALLCAGEYLNVESLEGLTVMFRSFYPDYAEGEDGKPMTLSGEVKRPAYLYTLYYHDQVLGMNVLEGSERITVEDYSIIFRDPRQYTLLQIKRDPFRYLAAVGGIMVLCSLLLAFYVRPEEIWAVRQADGRWAVAGKSRKGGTLFIDTLRERGEKEHD